MKPSLLFLRLTGSLHPLKSRSGSHPVISDEQTCPPTPTWVFWPECEDINGVDTTWVWLFPVLHVRFVVFVWMLLVVGCCEVCWFGFFCCADKGTKGQLREQALLGSPNFSLFVFPILTLLSVLFPYILCGRACSSVSPSKGFIWFITLGAVYFACGP